MGSELIVGISSLVVLIIIAVVIIRSFKKVAEFKREAANALSANAVVIGKRSQNQIIRGTSYTYNFVTFDIEGIGRLEFKVTGGTSGLLVEGDKGALYYLTDPYRFVKFNLNERAQQF